MSEPIDHAGLRARLMERRQIRFNAPVKGGGFEKLVDPEDLDAAIALLDEITSLTGERDAARSDSNFGKAHHAEALTQRETAEAELAALRGVTDAMYDEYMRDEECDYVVINSLIEAARLLSPSPLAIDAARRVIAQAEGRPCES